MEVNNGNGASGTLPFDEEMCERYLLGELTEAERDQFETAYFMDDAFFERFVAIKTELLDLYARGELDASVVERLKPHFLATAPRRQRIAESAEFTRAITTISNRNSYVPAADMTTPNETVGWIASLLRFFTFPRLAGAATLLLVIFGGFLYLKRPVLNVDIEQAGQQSPNQGLESRTKPESQDADIPTPAESPKREVSAETETGKLDDIVRAENRVSGEDVTVVKRWKARPDVTISRVSRGKGKRSGPGLIIDNQLNRDKVELTGMVTDPSGTGVPGAEVVARNLKTGEKRLTVANDDGSYRFVSLAPGNYEIITNSMAFKRTLVRPLHLANATAFSLRIPLEPGLSTSVVKVPGDKAGLIDAKRDVAYTDKTRDESFIIADVDQKKPTSDRTNITLNPVATRGITPANTLRLGPNSTNVRLLLLTADYGYLSYSAKVTTVDGKLVWQATGLASMETATDGHMIHLDFASTLLKQSDYIVTLSGKTRAGKSETVREYYFHVERLR